MRNFRIVLFAVIGGIAAVAIWFVLTWIGLSLLRPNNWFGGGLPVWLEIGTLLAFIAGAGFTVYHYRGNPSR